MIPELMIFDMDGLLFNTERLFMNKRASILEKYGYTHHLEDYLQTIGLTGADLNRKLLDIYGDDYPADQISEESWALVEAHTTAFGPEIMPGIPALLEWLKEHGIPCCVASSSRHAVVEGNLKKAGLEQYFSFVVGGDEVTRSKPNPEIFRKACELAQVLPGHAMVLEDSENGVRAAAGGGIPVICIPDLKYPSDPVAALTTAILPDASKVIDWLTLKSAE